MLTSCVLRPKAITRSGVLSCGRRDAPNFHVKVRTLAPILNF